MHDPKISSSVLYRQLFSYESSANKLRHPGNAEIDQHYQIQGQDYKTWPPSADNLTQFTSSRQNDVLNLRNQICLVPLLHRLMDAQTASEILHQSRYTSITSNVATEARYSDLLRDRDQFKLLQKYNAAATMQLGSNNFCQAFTGIDDSLPGQSAAIRSTFGVEAATSLRGKQPSILSLSEPSRAADTVSFLPLRVSTSLPSSVMLSSHPSPCSRHRSPASPESPWGTSYHQQKIASRSDFISSIPLQPDLSFMGDLACRRDRTSLQSTLLSPAATSPSWSPLLSALPRSSPFSPLKRRPTSYAPYASQENHQAVSSSLCPTQHRHHHLNQHQFVTEPLYTDTSFGICVDSRPAPGKALLTKSLKQNRRRHRLELSGTLLAERRHTQQLSCLNKSVSAQTQFPRSSNEIAPPPFPMTDTAIRGMIQSNSALGHTYSHNIHHLPPPPPLVRFSDSSLPYPPTAATPIQPAPPLTQIKPSLHNPHPLYPTSPPSGSLPPSSFGDSHPDIQHTPLNLSISNVPPKFPITPPNSSIPSPIGYSPITNSAHWSVESIIATLPSNNSLNRHVTSAQDEAIDEHFRRSLGKSYDESSTLKSITLHFQDKIHSVDDHFARALGDKIWNKIKDRSEPTPLESLTNAVDSHFSKALGASVWKKLNSDHKLVEPASLATEGQPKSLSNEQQDNNLKSSSTSGLQTSSFSPSFHLL